MKKISTTNIILFVLLVISICYSFFNKIEKPKMVSLKTHADSLSYSLGYVYGLDFPEMPFQMNMRMFFQGFLNAADPNYQILTEDEIIDLWERLSDDFDSLYTHDFIELYSRNAEEGREFMAQNALNPDVITTDSGLQYRVINAGTGRRTQANSTVVAHYTGRFISGEVFDSSRFHGEAMTIEINRVIEGWEEALLLMREGDVFEIVVPYNLAYGEEGYEIIEPGSTLIFEMELVEVLR
ncbi:MAG: FKBP-type peptidyl-prolyl cis-trans isomerase [Candidatus Cloacimonetes bacterium]|nr:FKBP-type peptidyl-prolyl cis-trans isomerase [Candidatus Cloacimonadota bacterium]